MTHRGIPLKWLAGCSMLPVLRTINMEHIDLRKLNRGELTQVRRQVVRLKKMWKTGKEIEELTGVQQNRVSEIWTVYQREGDGSLEPKKRGFQKGTHLLLTPEEQSVSDYMRRWGLTCQRPVKRARKQAPSRI